MSGEHASQDPSAERTTPVGRTFLWLSTIAVGGGLYLIIDSGTRLPSARTAADGLRLLTELLLFGIALAVWTWLMRRNARREIRELSDRHRLQVQAQIVERRRAEHIAAERTALLRALLDNTPAAIALKDAEGRYTFINRSFAMRAGQPGEEIVGRTGRDLFSADKAAIVAERDRTVMAAGRAVARDSVHVDRDGNPSFSRWIKFPVRGAEGAPVGIGIIQTDVTDAKRSETGWHDSEDRFRAIFEHAPLGMSLTDRDGRCLLANAALCAMLGRSRQDLIEPQPAEGEHGDKDVRLQDLYGGTGNVRVVEKAMRHGDGRLIWVAVSSALVRDAYGEPWLNVNLYDDITERRRMVSDMRLARDEAERASRAQSRFLAAASHDLRQPLQALGLFLSVLVSKTREGRTVNPGEMDHLLGRMRVSLDTLEGLLSALLDVSKLDAGVMLPEVRAFPLQRLLDRLDNEFRPLAAKKGLDLRIVASSSAVLSDPNMLDRILRNLMSNAIHCTATGTVLLGVRRRGFYLSIQVLDTGPGIPADQIEAIFEEFHRLDSGENREHGLGLGLAIVRRVAALLRHPVGVRSEPGRGSLFSVDVPMTAAVPTAVPAPAAVVPTPPVPGRTILVIDDDVVVLDSLRLLLRTWGYRTLIATSVEQARDLIAAGGHQPDLILADLRLSNGSDGMAAIQAVRQAVGRMVPGIILTGNTAPKCGGVSQRDALTVLHKPVPPEKLGMALIHALSMPPVSWNEPLPR